MAPSTTRVASTAERQQYDALVVGARCAGAASAMVLARHGMRVLAIDRGTYGSDTVSTHALMRGAVQQLGRWGVLPAIIAAGTPAVRTTTFFYGGEALRVAIKPRDGVEALYAPRRTLLDRLLVDAARDAGSEIIHGVRLASLVRSAEGRVTGAVLEDGEGHLTPIAAGIVIGADGLRSTVARLTGAQTTVAGQHATGVVYGHWLGLEVDGYQWSFDAGLGTGAIPTNGGACVFVTVPAARFRVTFREDLPSTYHRLLRQGAAVVAEAVAAGRLDGHLHGFSGQPGYLRDSVGPGWALVGDAGYFKDPFTAHGITDALRDVDLLASAIAAGTTEALERYVATRDEMSRAIFDVTDRIASFEWDLAEIRTLHETLTAEMARETHAMAADGWPTSPTSGTPFGCPIVQGGTDRRGPVRLDLRSA